MIRTCCLGIFLLWIRRSKHWIQEDQLGAPEIIYAEPLRVWTDSDCGNKKEEMKMEGI